MSEDKDSAVERQNQYLFQHGIDLGVYKKHGWDFMFFICPSINELIEYTGSLQKQYGIERVQVVPLVENGRQPGGVSGYAFFVKPKP